MQQPFISIIVPCYNQAQYLDESLQSVLNQTYQNWECIIVNDGSPDNTEEIALQWTNKDPRFRYLHQENSGVSAARNNGINNSKGEWILPLDGDDRIDENYLRLASYKFSEIPHIIYCKGKKFGITTGNLYQTDFEGANILIENSIFCSAFFQKKLWEKVGGYDENMINGYEDWEFWIRLYSTFDNLIVTRLDYFGFSYRLKEVSRNTLAMKDHDKKIKEYILQKHNSLYYKCFGDYMEVLRSLLEYKKENSILKKITKSKRFLIYQKLSSIFDKFSFR